MTYSRPYYPEPYRDPYGVGFGLSIEHSSSQPPCRQRTIVAVMFSAVDEEARFLNGAGLVVPAKFNLDTLAPLLRRHAMRQEFSRVFGEGQFALKPAARTTAIQQDIARKVIAVDKLLNGKHAALAGLNKPHWALKVTVSGHNASIGTRAVETLGGQSLKLRGKPAVRIVPNHHTAGHTCGQRLQKPQFELFFYIDLGHEYPYRICSYLIFASTS